MNPLLFKAHPLLYRTVDLLLHPGGYSVPEVAFLLAVFLGINQLWTLGLWLAVQRLAEVRLSLPASYGLALPACLFYAPLLMTVLGDVLDHGFRLEERAILIFVLVVGSQMLGAIYGLAIRTRQGKPVGIAIGLAISLALFLASLPFGLLLLWFNSIFRVL